MLDVQAEPNQNHAGNHFMTRWVQRVGKLWLMIISSILIFGLSGCAFNFWNPPVSPSTQVVPQTPEQQTHEDPQAQPIPPEPYELGEVIAQNQWFYREFWGTGDNGAFIVQDFYQENHAKRTDPYTMLRRDEAQNLLLNGDMTPSQQYAQLRVTGIDGPYVQWFPDGTKAIEGNYSNALPQGTWTLWYENGNPMLQETLVNGVSSGESIGWYPNAKQAGRGQYANGVRQGVWTVWYNNGAKMQEGAYVDDQQQGAWTYWYDNGNRKEAGNYEAGVRVGMWTWWDRDGAQVREAEYGTDGAPISGTAGSGIIQPRYR